MLTLPYQCGICSFNVLFKTFVQSLHTYGSSFLSSSFPFLFICHHFLLSQFLLQKKYSNGQSKRLIFEKGKKRLGNTVAWILLILVLTYFPGLLFGGVLVAKGINNLAFWPYYVIFMQLNGVLNPLLNVSRIKKKKFDLVLIVERCFVENIHQTSTFSVFMIFRSKSYFFGNCTHSWHQTTQISTVRFSKDDIFFLQKNFQMSERSLKSTVFHFDQTQMNYSKTNSQHTYSKELQISK